MPLESLHGPEIDIHDLAPESPEREGKTPRQKYEDLKKTDLYDPETGLWRHALDYVENNAGLGSENQLLDLLIQTDIDPVEAKRRRTDLKKQGFYNKRQRLWGRTQQINYIYDTTSQILDLVVLSRLNPKEVDGRMAYLKSLPSYDKATGRWKSMINIEKGVRLSESNEFTADVAAQLCEIIVVAQRDPKAAEQLYEALKTTDAYNAETQRWRPAIKSDGAIFEEARDHQTAPVELLSVIAQAEFNPQSARAHFEELKASVLYDRKQQMWNWYHVEGARYGDEEFKTSEAQLLGILAEMEIEKHLPRFKSEAETPVPVMRKF